MKELKLLIYKVIIEIKFYKNCKKKLKYRKNKKAIDIKNM